MTRILSIIGREFFQVALITYLLLELVEVLRAGAVSNFFDTRYVLFLAMGSALAMVLPASSRCE